MQKHPSLPLSGRPWARIDPHWLWNEKNRKSGGSEGFYSPPGPLLACAPLSLRQRAWIINLAKIKKNKKSSASSRSTVDMNNGRSNTTTGIWWVKHSAMADNWGIHCGPYPTSTSGIAQPNTRGQTEVVFITELKDYLSTLASTQHLLFWFLEGFAFICPFCFSRLCWLLSPTLLKPLVSLPWLFFKGGTWLSSALWDRIVSRSPPGGCVFECGPASPLLCNHAALW